MDGSHPDVADLLELVATLAAAAGAAEAELECLADPEFDWPLPDDLVLHLDLSWALVAVLQRVYDATGDEGRRRLDAMIQEELAAGAHRWNGLPVPVSESVTGELASVREMLRRRALTDGALSVALRDVPDSGWSW